MQIEGICDKIKRMDNIFNSGGSYRQLTRAFTDIDFNYLQETVVIFVTFVTMTVMIRQLIFKLPITEQTESTLGNI